MAALQKVQLWMDAFAELPGTGCQGFGKDSGWADVLIDSMGGAMPSFDGKSSFAHNKALFHMQFNVFFDPSLSKSASDTAACQSWLDKVYNAAGAAGISDSAYRNYPAVGLLDWQRKYYGANYPRLQLVKAAYDPHNFFKYDMSIELPKQTI